jgi:hypothetical protein
VIHKLLPWAAATAIGFFSLPGSAQTPAWREACTAIQPTIPCNVENRFAIEDAMRRCRTAADKPSCHRDLLAQRAADAATDDIPRWPQLGKRDPLPGVQLWRALRFCYDRDD